MAILFRRETGMNTGATKPNVRIHIRRRVVQIQRKRPIIRRVIPIAAADRRATNDSTPSQIILPINEKIKKQITE